MLLVVVPCVSSSRLCRVESNNVLVPLENLGCLRNRLPITRGSRIPTNIGSRRLVMFGVLWIDATTTLAHFHRCQGHVLACRIATFQTTPRNDSM
jgi:hypothetical protein